MSFKSSPVLSLDLPLMPQRLSVTALLVSGLVMPWLAGLSFAYCLFCAVLCVGWSVAELYRSGWGQPKFRIVRLSWQQDHSWVLQFAEGEPVVAQLSPRSWRTPWLLVLIFQPQADSVGRSRSVMLWRGQSSRHAWHQWQLRLQLEGRQLPSRKVADALS